MVNGAVIDTGRSTTNKRDYLLGSPPVPLCWRVPRNVLDRSKSSGADLGEGSPALFTILRPLAFSLFNLSEVQKNGMEGAVRPGINGYMFRHFPMCVLSDREFSKFLAAIWR